MCIARCAVPPVAIGSVQSGVYSARVAAGDTRKCDESTDTHTHIRVRASVRASPTHVCARDRRRCRAHVDVGGGCTQHTARRDARRALFRRFYARLIQPRSRRLRKSRNVNARIRALPRTLPIAWHVVSSCLLRRSPRRSPRRRATPR